MLRKDLKLVKALGFLMTSAGLGDGTKGNIYTCLSIEAGDMEGTLRYDETNITNRKRAPSNLFLFQYL